MRTRQAGNHRVDISTPLTNRELNPSLIPVPLHPLPPIVKGLPLSPIRTPEEQPTTPVRNHPSLHPELPKPNIDMSVLKAASVSAIPHSAFSPYDFPRSGSRQPRKSYRAILKFTDTPGSLPIESNSEYGTVRKLEHIESASSSDSGRHSPPLPRVRTSGKAEFRPQTGSAPSNRVSSDRTQPRPPDPDATLEAFSWLADPSVSASTKSSKSSRHEQQPQINKPETSGESDHMLHKSFLNLDTPKSELVLDSLEEKRRSPASPKSPHSSSNVAQAYQMGNARYISIYSRYARPVSRKPVPSPLMREANRLSTASSWRDKPLPSPRSNQSGKAGSATAQSFVVSPLSSVFIP